MIAIVDYGLGNIRAYKNLFERVGINLTIARNEQQLIQAEKIILPGVGAFDDAMSRLSASGMRGILDDLVMGKRIPVLGVCVGMQMLAKSSEEGVLGGLGWIDGIVTKMKPKPGSDCAVLPHMGWNGIRVVRPCELVDGCNDESRYYFLHSYAFKCMNPDDVVALTDYGCEFASVVRRGNVHGVQFHPEKSHGWGIDLLMNFARM